MPSDRRFLSLADGERAQEMLKFHSCSGGIVNQIALSAGKVGPNRLESFHFPTESEQRDLTVQQSAADEPTMTQI